MMKMSLFGEIEEKGRNGGCLGTRTPDPRLVRATL